MDSHVEIIRPIEKIAGYLPPERPATAGEVAAELERIKREFPGWPSAAFKVLRTTVSWEKHYPRRRLRFNNRTVSCRCIGGVREWWFVSLQVMQAERLAAIEQARP